MSAFEKYKFSREKIKTESRDSVEKEPILKGTPASGGVARGVVKIVKDIQDTPSFKEGSVLVTRITDPSMVMMMARSVAIVTDIGGLTSHPAIVSREMGIPCIVNSKDGTKILKNGQDVVVDGTEGKVYSAD
ncbi:MAG: PEP-utilizing enzyme [bacterium]|nr:PEP-utilizing enzyme [bacterium]